MTHMPWVCYSTTKWMALTCNMEIWYKNPKAGLLILHYLILNDPQQG